MALCAKVGRRRSAQQCVARLEAEAAKGATQGDGTVYFGSWDGKIYAVKGSSKGATKGWWSQFRQGLTRTGAMDVTNNDSLYQFVGD